MSFRGTDDSLAHRAAVLAAAREIATAVIAGLVSPYDGANRIWHLTLSSDEPITELDPFVYAASEWESRPEDRKFFDEMIVREADELLRALPS